MVGASVGSGVGLRRSAGLQSVAPSVTLCLLAGLAGPAAMSDRLFVINRVWYFAESTMTGPRSSQCFGDTAQVRQAIASGQSSNVFIKTRNA